VQGTIYDEKQSLGSFYQDIPILLKVYSYQTGNYRLFFLQNYHENSASTIQHSHLFFITFVAI
jgi:hypothetical protein